MAKLAGSSGVAVMVYWNAARFEDALKDFYGKSPFLCGPLDGATIRLPKEDAELGNAGMVTKSGYSTKWTSLKGAQKIFQERPELEVLEMCEIGNKKGVAVAFRLRSSAMRRVLSDVWTPSTRCDTNSECTAP